MQSLISFHAPEPESLVMQCCSWHQNAACAGMGGRPQPTSTMPHPMAPLSACTCTGTTSQVGPTLVSEHHWSYTLMCSGARVLFDVKLRVQRQRTRLSHALNQRDADLCWTHPLFSVSQHHRLVTGSLSTPPLYNPRCSSFHTS